VLNSEMRLLWNRDQKLQNSTVNNCHKGLDNPITNVKVTTGRDVHRTIK